MRLTSGTGIAPTIPITLVSVIAAGDQAAQVGRFMDPVVEDSHVGLCRPEARAKGKGDFGVFGGNAANSFFVTEGITER